MGGKAKTLTELQAKFVAELLSGKTPTQAATDAGYSGKNNGSMASYLIQNVAPVREAIQKARAKIVEKGIYSLEKAMKEAQESIDFAKKTDNANAYVKAVELRAKLNGLLVERHDLRVAGFSLMVNTTYQPPLALTQEKNVEQVALPESNAEEIIESEETLEEDSIFD